METTQLIVFIVCLMLCTWLATAYYYAPKVWNQAIEIDSLNVRCGTLLSERDMLRWENAELNKSVASLVAGQLGGVPIYDDMMAIAEATKE